MIAKMTSNIGQIALAAIAALALTFPSPEEAKRAILDAVTPDHAIQIKADGDDAVLIAPQVGHETVLTYDPAAECLTGGSELSVRLIELCTQQLYTELTTKPLKRETESLLAASAQSGHTDIAEQKLLALTKLCRSLWVANGGNTIVLDSEPCRYAVSGLEQSVRMQ